MAKLEKEGIRPSSEADRDTLLRRVSLDLTGLPPSPRELQDWFAKAWPEHKEDILYIRLGLRLGYAPAKGTAIAMLKSETSSETAVQSLLEVLGQTENVESAPLFLTLLEKSKSEKVREAAKGDDPAKIKAAISELEQASHALSKTLYEAGARPGGPEAAAGAGAKTDGQGGGGKDEPIDAEFEVK